MQISNIKLLKAIQTANMYFHQHLEIDKEFKKQFYRIKDEIIKGILKGYLKGMEWQIVRYEVDDLTIRYAVIDINASTKTTSAYLGVHFPVKKLPESMRHSIPEGTTFKKYAKAEYTIKVSTKEFRESYEYMRKAAKSLWKKKVNDMHHNDFLSTFGKTLKGTKYYLMAGKNGTFLLYKRGKTIEDQPKPIVLSRKMYKQAVIETMSFNFDGVSAWLLENGIEIPNKNNMETKKQKLDEYSEFMNRHVLNPIGVNLYDLLDKGFALQAPKGM